MIYGLTSDELSFLTENLIKPLKSLGAKVYIFGSRAKGAQSKFSDIDILYVAQPKKNVPSHKIHTLLSGIEDSDFPYHIDLVSFDELATSYKENVLKERVEL